MRSRAALSLALFAAALSTAPSARANGRYPLSNQLVVAPKDPSHIAVRATFGLVLSADQGKSWHWVCEAAAQFVNGEDPPIEVTANASLIVASSQAFTTSPDFGCNWAQPEPDQVIVDSDVDRSNPERVVAAASLFDAGKYRFALRQSVDNGKTWQALGVPADGYVLTLAVAPSEPQRIYVSATSLTMGIPSVVRTDDGGATWHPFLLPAQDAPVPYIAAIDPLNADRVYVRAPTTAGGDVLFVTENAGKDWKQILKAKGTLAGFALSPDGSQIVVGGPSDPVRRASAKDYAFSPVNDEGVTCLTWTDAGIFACADQAKAGFSVGLSADRGATFKPLFEPKNLTLQVCEAGTPVAMSCPNAWHGLAPVIGADPSTPTYAGADGSGAGGSSGGGASSAGTQSAGGAPEAAGAPSAGSAQGGEAVTSNVGTAPMDASPKSKSSSCSVAAPGAAGSWLWLVLALARRRRR